jgi:type II secretory pathway pseudopilin PulG
MDEFLKMDIFFFVATVVTIVLGILSAYILWRLARIMKNVEYISKQVVRESDIVRQDLAEMRAEIRQGKGRIKSLFGFLKKSSARATKES